MSGNVQTSTQKAKTGCGQVWWKCVSGLNTDGKKQGKYGRYTSDNKGPTTPPLFT